MLLDNLTALKNRIDSLPFNMSERFIRPLVSLTRQIFFSCGVFVYTPVALICWTLNIKFPYVYVERIGHLMYEPDCFIKEQLLKRSRSSRAILLASKSKSANQAAVRYWSKYFIVIESPILASLLKPFQAHPFTKFDTSRYVGITDQTADLYPIHANWGLSPPLLKLDRCDVERGNEILKLMGIPAGAWYICVHAREGKYEPYGEHLHKFRNISINDFEKSVAYIVSQGGWCIRMGDSSMSPAPNVPGLIDYALSTYKQDWMDLFLAASCKFFLGSNSGAYTMATIFGRPSAVVGMAPLTVMGSGINDLSIQMLCKSDELGRTLSFEQIMQSPVANYRFAEEYEKAGISLVHNTSDDILDMAIEQLQRVEGKYTIDADDELRQEKFKAMLKPGHYCYGTASRIGNAFLKKHEYLLD